MPWEVDDAGATGAQDAGGRRGRRTPVVLLILALLVAAAGAYYALHGAAVGVSHGAVHPTPVFSSAGYDQRVTPDSASRVLLTFVPDQDAESLGAAMCAATGHAVCAIPGGFPGRVTVGALHDGHYPVTVQMSVDVARLLRRGEILTGSLPGDSNLAAGELAVSTNSAVYGVNMDPRAHTAIYTFWLASDGGEVWATNWNALGAVSQSTSLQ